MRFLVDANVLSEATQPAPHAGVLRWLSEQEREIAIDPVILGELRFGILLLEPGRRRQRLESWFEAGAERLRCLVWDESTGLTWARLLAELRARGEAMPVKDSLIAATALQHGLVMVTRNVRDFEKSGLEVFNPFVADG